MISVQFYSTKPLENRELSLYNDPYESPEAIAILKELGVFYWRDEEETKAKLIDVSELEFPCNAFKHFGVMDQETWEMEEWLDDYEEYEKKHGDRFCWLHFNKKVRIISVGKESIIVK